MSAVKSSLKAIVPPALWHWASDARDGLSRLTMLPSATLHPLRRQSIARLSHYQNIHQGQRCFIIGNGPSLKNMDLSPLKNEFTFGMNRIYLLYPKMGFPTTYYVSINSLVIEQCADDIEKLPVPKFLSWRSQKLIRMTENTMFLHTTYTGKKFAKDARKRLWEGATVTYVALQLAYFMGFRQVILIGVDHSFASKGKPNTTIVSQGDDPDHFNPGYFGKGFRWQLPDLETSEIAYRLARKTYEENEREVLDATVGGKLTVFPKVDYQTLFR